MTPAAGQVIGLMQSPSLFQFTFTGVVGQTWVVESSTSTAGPWTLRETRTLTSALQTFADTDPAAPRRFYKARRGP